MADIAKKRKDAMLGIFKPPVMSKACEENPFYIVLTSESFDGMPVTSLFSLDGKEMGINEIVVKSSVPVSDIREKEDIFWEKLGIRR